MGGRAEYYGPIEREPNEPVFHARWEARTFGMSSFLLALFGANTDAFRRAMERLSREAYMAGYYQRWLAAFERMLVRAGYLGPDELDAQLEGRRAAPGPRRGSRLRLVLTARALELIMRPTLPPRVCAQLLPRLLGTARPATRRRRFSIGDRVRVHGGSAAGFTRRPGYVAGRRGVIAAHHGATLFSDARGARRRARPQHLYTVAFEGGELWGESAEPGTEVRVDLFESYMVPA
jgi:nitrile hydratase subunit beta